MAKKWRVKLYDENNDSWDLVMICHQFSDVHRWVKAKNIRATHFSSLDDAKDTINKFELQNGKYNLKIVEI